MQGPSPLKGLGPFVFKRKLPEICETPGAYLTSVCLYSNLLKTLQAVDGIPHSRYAVLRRPDGFFCSKPQYALAAALEEKVVSRRVSTACVRRNLLS